MEVTVFSQVGSPATHDCFSVSLGGGGKEVQNFTAECGELVVLVKDTEHIKLTRKLSYMLTNFYCNAS